MIGEYLSRAPGTPVPDDRRAGYRPALPPADPNIIALCGEVGRPGFTAQALLDKLAAAGRRAVTLVIDSHGGDVDEALRIVAVIHNYQRDGRSPVTAVVNGEASSAASIVMQACAHRAVGPKARMTLHDPAASWPRRGVTRGVTARDLLDACATRSIPDGARPAAAVTISALRRTGEQFSAAYAWRTHRPATQWRDTMAAGQTYVGQGIVFAGLADEVAY